MSPEESQIQLLNSRLAQSAKAERRLKTFRLISLTICASLTFYIYSSINSDIKNFKSNEYQEELISQLKEQYEPRIKQLTAYSQNELLDKAKSSLRDEYDKRKPFLEQEIKQVLTIDSFKVHQILKHAMDLSIDEIQLELNDKFSPAELKNIKQNLKLRSDLLARSLQYNFSTETEKIQQQIEVLKELINKPELSADYPNLNDQTAKRMIKEALITLIQEGAI